MISKNQSKFFYNLADDGHEKLHTSDWLKMSAFSCNMSAKLYSTIVSYKYGTHALKNFVCLDLLQCFSCTLLTSNNLISLSIWCDRRL